MIPVCTKLCLQTLLINFTSCFGYLKIITLESKPVFIAVKLHVSVYYTCSVPLITCIKINITFSFTAIYW